MDFPKKTNPDKSDKSICSSGMRNVSDQTADRKLKINQEFRNRVAEYKRLKDKNPRALYSYDEINKEIDEIEKIVDIDKDRTYELSEVNRARLNKYWSDKREASKSLSDSKAREARDKLNSILKDYFGF